MTKDNLRKMWVKGLLMAAVVATALPIPDLAFAQLVQTATNSQNSVFKPMLDIMSYACYVIGGVLVIGGTLKFKAHAENASSNPLSHGFSRVGAGALLLALPYLMGLANSTASSTMGTTSTFHPFGWN